MDASTTCVIYGVTPDRRYLDMAYSSIASLQETNPGTPFALIARPHPQQPRTLAKLAALDAYTALPTLLYVDADTRFTAPLSGLPGPGQGIAARREWWTADAPFCRQWGAYCKSLGHPDAAFLSSGAFALPSHLAPALLLAWRTWVSDLYDSVRLSRWLRLHILDEIALSLAVAQLGLPVAEWGPTHHAWAWTDERGIIDHYGAKHWQPLM